MIARARALAGACLLAAASCDAVPRSERPPGELPPLAFSDTTVMGGMHAEGPAAFGRVRAAIFDGAGRIVVADGQSQELLPLGIRSRRTTAPSSQRRSGSGSAAIHARPFLRR